MVTSFAAQLDLTMLAALGLLLDVSQNGFLQRPNIQLCKTVSFLGDYLKPEAVE